MPEKIEIIYDFDGYKTIIKKEGEEKMEEYKLKNLSGASARKILELADQKDIDTEKIIDFINKLRGEKTKMTNLTDDERFNEEEKKVQEFMAKPENKGVSYRDAVLKVLDRTEPKPKKEFTAEEIKEQENLKTVENYLDANPRATYSEACKVLFKGEKVTLEEKLIEEFMEKNPKSTYREAVIESLSLLKKEPKKEE